MISPRKPKFPKTDSSAAVQTPLSTGQKPKPAPFAQVKDGKLVLAFTSLPMWTGTDFKNN